MAYEQHPDGTLTPLPKQNIDTGMGLERIAAIVQDVRSVYETDAYQSIMDWVAVESGVAFGESDRATKAHRVIADHGRGMTFLVGDGVTPSNEGRGYVLRRIIRRAVQQARSIGLDDLWRVTDVVVEQMADAYPELEENRERIRDSVRAEEDALRRDARTRDEALRGDRGSRRHLRRGRVRPDGHLRLPVRADARSSRSSAAWPSTRTTSGRAWRSTARSRAAHRPASSASSVGRRPTSSATTVRRS